MSKYYYVKIHKGRLPGTFSTHPDYGIKYKKNELALKVYLSTPLENKNVR